VLTTSDQNLIVSYDSARALLMLRLGTLQRVIDPRDVSASGALTLSRFSFGTLLRNVAFQNAKMTLRESAVWNRILSGTEMLALNYRLNETW